MISILDRYSFSMVQDFTIRPATVADAAACADIYAPYVETTAITFEVEAPDAGEMAARITSITASHAWLVLEESATVVGYAYAGPYASRAAFARTCEGSVYLEMDHRGGGRGAALYKELIRQIGSRGYRRLIGLVTQPNEPSVRLHQSLGFTQVGVLHRVGYKFGDWHDLMILELDVPGEAEPSPSSSLDFDTGNSLVENR